MLHPEKPVARQFLAFKLGLEEYGIDILRVQGIRSYEESMHLANTPDFVKGVVDLRIKFRRDSVAYDSFTVVIVISVVDRVFGIVVDGVSDVITLTNEQMRPVPEFNSAIASDHLLAIGAFDGRMLNRP